MPFPPLPLPVISIWQEINIFEEQENSEKFKSLHTRAAQAMLQLGFHLETGGDVFVNASTNALVINMYHHKSRVKVTFW